MLPASASMLTTRPARDVEAFRTGEAAQYLTSRQKRALDLGAALTLIFLLLPMLVIVALLIRATSKGPVLFRQTRCGARGRPFTIYKFRSMHHAPDQGSHIVQATRTDPRVTPIGAFIRRSSIDELPQLLNVVQGHMSLIGPRPHAVSHDTYYAQHIPRYGERFSARPGLSGLAQISGARGETPLLSDMERRIELDLAYIRDASLWGDCKLIIGTVREMIFSKTAY
jgi:putative colanic acid biosynthesis UDP-glucose lipid carrier transferase